MINFAHNTVLKLEPYYELSALIVCELMDSSNAEESVSDVVLNEAKETLRCCQFQQKSYSSLRKSLDEFSIFAARNPMVRLSAACM